MWKQLHRASQAWQERSICSFLQSLAAGCLVQAQSLVQPGEQATKRPVPASRLPGSGDAGNQTGPTFPAGLAGRHILHRGSVAGRKRKQPNMQKLHAESLAGLEPGNKTAP